jgi:hypothetical protein
MLREEEEDTVSTYFISQSIAKFRDRKRWEPALASDSPCPGHTGKRHLFESLKPFVVNNSFTILYCSILLHCIVQ